MPLDEKYLARRWLRRRIKWAKTPEEHPQWEAFLGQRFHVTVSPQGTYQGGEVQNPNPQGREKTVTFSTAYKDPRFRQQVHDEFEAWKGRLKARPRPQVSPEERIKHEDDLVRLAHDGEIAAKDALGEKTINDTFSVKMKEGDLEDDFIYKPSSGAADKLFREKGVRRARVGIDHNQQHVREEAAYRTDRLFGDGGIVPPTVARAEMDDETDGSYQQKVEATPLILGLQDLPKRVTSEQLAENPSFQRLMALDLIQGHEDRHAKNVMYYFDGEPSAENLRFVAIDNGLSMADPADTQEPNDYYYVNPFETWFDATDYGGEYDASPEMATVAGPPPDDEWKDVPLSGQQAVEQVLTTIPEQMHERMKQVDLGEFVKQQLDSGVPPRAAQAAAVRLAALQADPSIFGAFLEMTDGNLKDAWKEFQQWSGHMPDQLLKTSGSKVKLEDILGHVVSHPRRRSRKKKPAPEVEAKGVARIKHPDIDKFAEKSFKQLKSLIGERHAEQLKEKKDERDEGWHMTVVRPKEMKQLVERDAEKLREANPDLSKTKSREQAQAAIQKRIEEAMGDLDWKPVGIGRAIQKGPDGRTWDNYSYHVVMDWPGGKKLREELGLDPEGIDFHITLGYRKEDIHDVDKGPKSIPTG